MAFEQKAAPQVGLKVLNEVLDLPALAGAFLDHQNLVHYLQAALRLTVLQLFSLEHNLKKVKNKKT